MTKNLVDSALNVDSILCKRNQMAFGFLCAEVFPGKWGYR